MFSPEILELILMIVVAFVIGVVSIPILLIFLVWGGNVD